MAEYIASQFPPGLLSLTANNPATGNSDKDSRAGVGTTQSLNSSKVVPKQSLFFLNLDITMIRVKLPFLFSFMTLLVFGSLTSLAQQQVHGLVIDRANGQPMPFVSITVAGTTFGTVSNQNGEFTLNLDKINKSDSVVFQYLGYETIKIKSNELKVGMTLEIREKRVSLKEISIVANPMSAEDLIRKAVEIRAENYPVIAQKREVFSRSNKASYINAFDLSMKKSDIPEFDQTLIRQMVDSVPRYSRSYSDYLYTLYTIPADSGKTKNKVKGIKNVVLKEQNGGGLDDVKRVITDLFVRKKDDNTFWKYKTGLLSFKESHVKIISESDSASKKNMSTLYFLNGDLGWDWDFIKKPNHYKYEKKGMMAIGDEDAYAIRFNGKSRGDFQGMIYISASTFAILRIEYSLKESKKDNGIDLLGISYSQEKDDGLVLWEKDQSGYFLKYSMKSTAMRYGLDRPFEVIRKDKRPIFNKTINEAVLHLNIQGRQEDTQETLVVYREKSDEGKFAGILEKGAKPERISSYADSIWKGYSIIEPTRQMKEYRTKIGN